MTTAAPGLADAKPNTETPIHRQSAYGNRAYAACRWWTTLQPQQHEPGTTPGDRATLARLRRGSRIAELAVEPATAELFHALKFERANASERMIDLDIATTAVLAGVLAHIRKAAKPGRDSLARAMGGRNGDRAVVSAIRMKRFMAAREPEDVLRQFQRILAMLGDTADVGNVAETVIAWLDSSPAGDRARTRFAFAYHGTAFENADGLDGNPIVSTDSNPKA